MMQVNNLSFFYGKKQILKNISLDFEPGRLYAVIGPNGSGKTTLLHALGRLHKAVGERLLDGECFDRIGRRDFAKRVALLPQDRNIPDMTVFDLVSAGRYPYLDFTGKMDEKDLAAVSAAMKATNTEILAEKKLKQISGGERQRAYIAMLTAQDTPYVLLDEPTSHLDISCEFEVMELLGKMRDDGKCVIAVLHDLSLALQYADDVILMSCGEVISAASPHKIIESGILERVFHVSCHVVKWEKEFSKSYTICL